MKAFLYGVGLQFKLDIRSKTMLITCYVVPLIFFFFMSAVFTFIDPGASVNLIASMTVFVVTMGALIGLPPSLAEIYGTDVKKVYSANGVPSFLGVATNFISSFLHLMIVCAVVFIVSPPLFKAALPINLPLYFLSLALLTLVTLAAGCVIGLIVKAHAKLTMIAMVVFLPSIILSGIMFPSSLLPEFMRNIAYVFPAAIGFEAMTAFKWWHLLVLLAEFAALAAAAALLLKRAVKR